MRKKSVPWEEHEPHKFLREVVLTYDNDECLIWPYKKLGGYPRLGRKGKIHRLVCTHFNGPPPTPFHQAAHSCGNPACVAKKHLRWATPKENTQDRKKHGTYPNGEKNSHCQLTSTQVLEIRSLRNKLSQHAIARQFNIGRGAIANIFYGRTWKWLE